MNSTFSHMNDNINTMTKNIIAKDDGKNDEKYANQDSIVQQASPKKPKIPLSASKVSESESPSKLKTVVCSGPGSPPAKSGPPPLTIVLDMQKEYGRHKKLLLGF